MTTQRVKERCIELLYNWSEVLEYEPKIKEAYQMLRRQGIVKQDPVTYDRVFINSFSLDGDIAVTIDVSVYIYSSGSSVLPLPLINDPC